MFSELIPKKNLKFEKLKNETFKYLQNRNWIDENNAFR